jgi:hypothetical protein
MKKLLLVAAAAAALAFAAGASAANTNLGGATTNADGSVTLNSTASPFSAGIDIGLPGVTNVGDITAFSLNISFPSGCPAGVPKLAIATVRGTISVSLSGGQGFTCAAGTTNVYVLNPSTPADTSQILGGSAADTWGHAQSEYDNLRVNSVQLVTTGVGQVATVSNIQLVITPGLPSPSM